MVDGFVLSEHACFQMQVRNVQEAWLDEALISPDQQLFLADKHDNTHYLKRIPEFGNRWLRVVVNPTTTPKVIITMFFDRRVK